MNSTRTSPHALLRHERRLQALVAASAQVVYRLSADGAELQRLSGHGFFDDATELTATWIDRYIPAPDHAAVRAAIETAVAQKSILEVEHRVARADGTVGWLRSRAVPVLDAEGAITEWLGAASDITERKQDEEARHAARDRDAFLLKLSDALQPLTDAAAVQRTATQLLGEQLGSDHVCYADVKSGEPGAIDASPNGYSAPAVDHASGHLPEAVLRCAAARLRAGDLWVVADAATDPALGDAERAAFAHAGLQAALVVPLVKKGRVVAQLAVLQAHAHAWTAFEVALVRETVDRARTAIERTHAEHRIAADLHAMTVLRDLSARLIAEDSVELLYQQIVDSAVAVMHADFGSVQMMDRDSGDLVLLASNGQVWGATPFWDRVPPAAMSACAAASRTGRRVIIADTHGSDLLAGTSELTWYEGAGLHAVQCTPLLSRDGRVLGMLSTHWRRPHTPGARELRLLDVIARQAADLIERRHAADKLRSSEERFRSIADSGVVAVAFFDPAGAILDANDAFLDMIGYSRAELASGDLRWDRLTPPEWMDVTREALKDFLTTGIIAPYEKQYFRRDGRRIWALFAGRRIESTGEGVAIVLDITARKQADEARQQSEQDRRAVADIVPDLLWSSEPDGTTTWYNRRWLEYTGQTLPQPVGSGWADAVHPEDRALAAHRYREAVERGTSLRHQCRIRNTKGEYRWFLARAEPLRDASGRVVRMYGAATDIHDLRQAQLRLQDDDQRKNHFLAVLGHELRNPLAAIRAGATLLGSPRAKPESKAAALPALIEQTTHMERLVDDLLDVTRIVQGRVQLRKEPVLLHDALRHALDMVRAPAEQGGFEIALDRPAEPLPVLGDPVRLTQVFVNLLGNAMKYSAGARRIEIATHRENRSAVVRVRDYGQGIPAALRPRLFEPFVQAEPGLTLQAGLGLGLAVVKQLVTLHDGNVEVISGGEHRGSEFIVRLPLAASPDAPPRR